MAYAMDTSHKDDIITGSPFQASFSYLESCIITVTFGHLMVKCAYPSNSTATGFQVIAQLSNSSEVHRLYANKTTDRQIQVSVLVEENGLYQVTIFAIRGGRGIVDSSLEYSGQLIVNLMPIVDTTHEVIGVDSSSKTTPDNIAGMYNYNNDPLILLILF